jgi:EpsI family protein
MFRDPAAPAAPSPSPAPAATEPEGARGHARRIVLLAIAVLAIAGAARAYADYANHLDRAAAGAPLELPPAPVGWTRFDSPVDSWQPAFVGADEARLATYARDGRAVHLFIAVYRQQREGAELVSSANSIAGDRNWARAGSGIAQAVIDGEPVEVAATRMVGKGRGRIAWHWFWVGGTYTASHYAAKALETRVKLLDEPRGVAAIAVAADYGETPAEAEALLREFLLGLKPIRPGLRRATGEQAPANP